MKHVNYHLASDPQTPHGNRADDINADFKLTAEQRDHLLRSVIGSQAIEGIDISREEAGEWLDEVLERTSHKMTLD